MKYLHFLHRINKIDKRRHRFIESFICRNRQASKNSIFFLTKAVDKAMLNMEYIIVCGFVYIKMFEKYFYLRLLWFSKVYMASFNKSTTFQHAFKFKLGRNSQ